MTLLAGSVAAFAQDKSDPLIDRGTVNDLLTSASVVIVIYLIANFIVRIIRHNFDYRLKTRIVDKQTPEGVITQLVQPERINNRRTILQWFCTLLGVGIGFALMAATAPLGLHSLAIMAFSVAAGLGAYYFFGRNAND